MKKELAAEFVGTFVLVSSVCGAALFSAPNVGFIAVALSIGAAVLAMAYAVGPMSGGHFNPAVTIADVQVELREAGKSAVAGETRSRDAARDTQTAPPHRDWEGILAQRTARRRRSRSQK